jgi:hypothetical protein
MTPTSSQTSRRAIAKQDGGSSLLVVTFSCLDKRTIYKYGTFPDIMCEESRRDSRGR